MRKKFLSLLTVSIFSSASALAAERIVDGPLALYVDAKDNQPRMRDSLHVTLAVQQPKNRMEPIISDIRAEINAAAMPHLKAAFVDFKFQKHVEGVNLYKAFVVLPAYLSYEADTLNLSITAYGLACGNLASLDCSFLAEKGSLTAKIAEVLALKSSAD